MANPFKGFRLLDLTHLLNEKIPTWTGECGFNSRMVHDYQEGSRNLEYQCMGGAGTHIDAPSHFIPHGRDIDELTLEELCIPICVIDLSAPLTPTAQIRLQDFIHYEKTYGKIPRGCVVLGNTGWSRHWETPEIYRGEASFPSFHREVGEILIEREVVGVGIDTLSPDPYGSGYPLHALLLGADKFILENLTQLDQLPKKGSFLIALPLKIQAGAESPVRAIALVPQ